MVAPTNGLRRQLALVLRIPEQVAVALALLRCEDALPARVDELEQFVDAEEPDALRPLRAPRLERLAAHLPHVGTRLRTVGGEDRAVPVADRGAVRVQALRERLGRTAQARREVWPVVVRDGDPVDERPVVVEDGGGHRTTPGVSADRRLSSWPAS